MKINNNLLIRRKGGFIVLIASAAIVLAAILYTKIFYEALISEDWYSVDGFRRIVIPDTFLYKSLLESEASIYLIAFAGIKNSIGPSLIWFLAGMNWYLVVLINALFVYISLKYLVQINSYFYLHIRSIYNLTWSDADCNLLFNRLSKRVANDLWFYWFFLSLFKTPKSTMGNIFFAISFFLDIRFLFLLLSLLCWVNILVVLLGTQFF